MPAANVKVVLQPIAVVAREREARIDWQRRRQAHRGRCRCEREELIDLGKCHVALEAAGLRE